jgi:hypothetical protein
MSELKGKSLLIEFDTLLFYIPDFFFLRNVSSLTPLIFQKLIVCVDKSGCYIVSELC